MWTQWKKGKHRERERQSGDECGAVGGGVGRERSEVMMTLATVCTVAMTVAGQTKKMLHGNSVSYSIGRPCILTAVSGQCRSALATGLSPGIFRRRFSG